MDRQFRTLWGVNHAIQWEGKISLQLIGIALQGILRPLRVSDHDITCHLHTIPLGLPISFRV